MTETCKHETLSFGSGGYYVICTVCHANWVAKKGDDDNFDYDRGGDQLTYGMDVRSKYHPDEELIKALDELCKEAGFERWWSNLGKLFFEKRAEEHGKITVRMITTAN